MHTVKIINESFLSSGRIKSEKSMINITIMYVDHLNILNIVNIDKLRH